MRSHPCSRCGGPRENPHSGYCRSCRSAVQRLYRAQGREQITPAEVARQRVRNSTKIKLHRWYLTPGRCQACGATNATHRIECHHLTYEGRWASWIINIFCRACHRQVHAGELDAGRYPPVDLRDVTGPTELLADKLT